MIKYLLLLLLPLTLFGQSQKISDMTSATSLTGSEYVPIVQTTNKKATVGLLRGWTSLGTAGQLLKVNSGATALEFFTPSYLTSVGTGVANELTYWSGTSTLGSLSTATYPSLTELSYVKGVTSAIQTQFTNKQPLDADLTTIAGLTATTDNFLQAKSSAWASRTPAQVKDDLNVIYLPNLTAYTGSGTSGSKEAATAVDQIPTTSLSVGARISAIITISGTERRLYTAELVTPANATAAIEVLNSVIRPNDFNSGTNNKVWREIFLNGVIDVGNFGVLPSATIYTSDQLAAVITAATAGDALVFRPGSYLMYGVTVNKALHFIGNGARIIGGQNAPMFSFEVDLISMRGFTFQGKGRNNASYPNQGGISITGCSNITISDMFFDNIPRDAIRTNASHISDTSGDFGSINIVNIHVMRSNIGFQATTRGEYVNVVGSSFVDCNTGLLIGAGNINVQGCNILDCSTVAIDLVTGVNDAHGVITGNQINHNTLAFRGVDIVNGEFIRDNNIYYGGMEFTDSNGITFTNNVIEGVEMYFDNCTGIQIEGNTMPNTATTTLTTNWNGNASTVFAFNNKTFANEYLSGWNFSAIGTTGQRVSKIWATDFEMTNSPIIGTPTKDNAATRVLTQNTGSGAIEYKDAGVTYSTAAMGVETVAYNHGVLSSAGVSSASIHVNAYYSNKTTLVAQITVVAIKTDGSASAHATVTARYRKDNSGTFNLDAAGTVTTSDASIIADVVGEINGTNPSIKVTMGAASGDYEISHSAITTWSTN